MGSLIEGIPDAVALQCLARVPLALYPTLELVSRAWRAAVRAPELFRVRSEAGTAEEWLYVNAREPDKVWQAYDPVRDRWATLPPIPSSVKQLANFGAAGVGGVLYVLGGGSDDVDPVTGDRGGGVTATAEVWGFDAAVRAWAKKAPMLTPRAQFACCVLDGALVVAGGFSARSSRRGLPHAERYVPGEDRWEALPDLCAVHNSACWGLVHRGRLHVLHKGVPRAQVYRGEERRWAEVDCDWAQQGAAAAVVGDEIFVLRRGVVTREPPLGRTLRSVPDCLHRIGYGVAGVNCELYVVGGVVEPRSHSLDLELMSDVDICSVKSEKPQWRKGARMTVSKGTVLGCAVVKL